MLEVAQRIPKAYREAKTIKGSTAKEAVAKQVPMLKGSLVQRELSQLCCD